MLQILKTKLDIYLRLTRLDKPVGIWLLMWPTLWGLLLAGQGHPPISILLVFVFGTVLMRSAGCVLNDIADRNFDGAVDRTKARPLAKQEITVKEAYLLALILVLMAFALVLTLNRLTVFMSAPALFLAASYPYTKRFFVMPQAYLGIAFGFGIPMAFAAVQHTIPIQAWLLLITNVAWSVAYDTQYAMVDRPDDLKIGIRSSAILFGRHDVLAIISCLFLVLAIWAWVALDAHLGWPFWAGWSMACAHVEYQHHAIKKRLPASCFQAFLSNVWFGAYLTIGLWLSYYFG